jgi:hypothetical protein
MNDTRLELDHDPGFQKWEWRLQRVGWVLLLAIVVIALTGALGDGPLAHKQARSADGSLDVSYERVARKRARETITVACGVRDDSVRLWISRDAARMLDLKRIEPEPSSVEGDHERLIYSFSGLRDRLLVTFHCEPGEAGRARGAIGIVDGATVAFDQFILP